MRIPKKIVETVEAEVIEVHVKVCDSGSYVLRAADGSQLGEREDYVPSFFPEEHYGDYLILNINIETGVILNWKKPDPLDVARCFKLIENEE